MKQAPTVCAICLVNGREEMVKRAIKSFREQTYGDRILYILDNGENAIVGALPDQYPDHGIMYHNSRQPAGRTIGTLRNYAMSWEPAATADIICHWDSDDWSHPRRIEEQVALLQASGKECVGYKDMLFWDTTPGQFCGAWIYRHPTKPLGTSLMYWRSVWEQRPFPDLPKAKGGTGEDVKWLEEVSHVAVSSLGGSPKNAPTSVERTLDRSLGPNMGYGIAPRMIASIHGGNTQHYDPAEYERWSSGTSWRRAPEWDEYCRKVMQL